MAVGPENQTGNGAGIVVGRGNELPRERGKAAYRAKASRFSNCCVYERSTKCKSRTYNWQCLAGWPKSQKSSSISWTTERGHEAKGKRESRTKGNFHIRFGGEDSET